MSAGLEDLAEKARSEASTVILNELESLRSQLAEREATIAYVEMVLDNARMVNAPLARRNAELQAALTAAEARVLFLEEQLDKAPHAEDCASLVSGTAAGGLECRPGDLDCNCFKSKLAGATEGA